ncbi:beta-glucoside-specific PTS transporter subunit IIABC [Pantoea dispersa]
MSQNDLAEKILRLVNGGSNIRTLTHCATRLRMEFNDRESVRSELIEKLPGVISVVERGGQFQIVVGNDVQRVFRVLEKAASDNKNLPEMQDKQQRGGLVSQIISVISTTFTPVIPAITGAGMIKALLAICKLTGVMNENSPTWQLLNIISDAAFFFLPVLLAYGAALKFECNTILAITIAGAMLHPEIGKMIASGKPIDFLGLPFQLSDYAGSVLPIILTVWLMSYIERFAEYVTPSIIKFFVKPMIILLVTAPLALVIVGPLGIWLNDLVASGAVVIDRHVSWLIPMLMGGLQPFLVITGTAWAMTPIATGQLSRNGFEMINGPGMLASNIAQGAATLCVALKTHNKNLRQLASSAGFTALLGITEPSLYGVTLKLKRPLIAAMIGGGCAGIYAGLSGLVRYAFVSPGLAALPAFIGANPMNIVHALITCAIAMVVTFALTWIMGFEDIPQSEIEPTKNVVTPDILKPGTIISPLKGELIALSEVKDEVFSSGLLGQGVAIRPSEGILRAPVSGKVMSFLPSGHAVGLMSNDGIEVLVHIGIDTVALGGKYFRSSLKVGDEVQAGEVLVHFDMEAIAAAGYELITPVVVINSDEYMVSMATSSAVNFGQPIMELSLKEKAA